MSRFTPLVVFSFLLIAGCGAYDTRPDSSHRTGAISADSARLATHSVVADDNLNAVAWMQAAVESDLIFRQTYRMASAELDAALADPTWEALPSGARKSPMVDTDKTAVIVDIDETVLDNSPYQARLIVNGTNYDEATWAEWCREENAAAIPGALEFTQLAASKGITVFYLSNRDKQLRDATLANLRKLNFPIADDDEVFLGLGMAVPGCEQKGSTKGCRRELISRNYRVLMQIGDQLGDLIDDKGETPQARVKAIAPYLDWIGQRWFMLPNPTYGHWESTLFENNWKLTPDQRRDKKQAALKLN